MWGRFNSNLIPAATPKPSPFFAVLLMKCVFTTLVS
jgi:hypothetical protein